MDVVLKMQLNVLIHLAMVDGQITKEEQETLESIAAKHGVSTTQLEEMIQYPKPIESLGALSNDVKFEQNNLVSETILSSISQPRSIIYS